MRPLLVLAVAAALACAGCAQEERYAGVGLFAFAITPDTPPFLTGEDGSIFIVETRVELPIDPPTQGQLDRLADPGDLPFPSRPYCERGDYEIEVDWTVSNLSEDRVQVSITLNGFNEFHEYMPGVQIIDDALVPDFSGWERTLELEPLERRSGTIREEELDEVAVDLATVVNGAPNSNQIVHFQNQSDHDARSMMYIPEIVPALTGFRLGLRTEQATSIVLEASVRVRDVHDRIAPEGEQPWTLPAPAPFVPVGGEAP